MTRCWISCNDKRPGISGKAHIPSTALPEIGRRPPVLLRTDLALKQRHGDRAGSSSQRRSVRSYD
jgi:hypothetical protein